MVIFAIDTRPYNLGIYRFLVRGAGSLLAMQPVHVTARQLMSQHSLTSG